MTVTADKGSLCACYNVTMLPGRTRRKLSEMAQERTALSEHDVKGLLREMGFSVPAARFIRTGDAAAQNLELTYPLVAKVSSGNIASKSELHGVRVGLRDGRQLKAAIEELFRIENAEGVLVEEMAPPGVEVIVGGVVDRQFGPVMMFGLGGIFTELFRDVSFGLAPLDREDAEWMISEIRGRRLLEGYRGAPPVDQEALVAILIGVSEVMATGLVEEMDLNPVCLYARGAIVLDAKMKLRMPQSG